MIKHKNQRVGVFIDVQNMYYSAKHIYNHKVNFGEILKEAVGERQLIRGIAYVVKATGDEKPFFEALNERGLETREREMQVFESGAKKADWDVGIAVDAIRIGEILDVIILVSGDGDFYELVEYLKHHGRQVEVIGFRKTTSTKLADAADVFTDLMDDPERFLIGFTQRTPRKTQTAPKKPEPQKKTAPAPKPSPTKQTETKETKPSTHPRRRSGSRGRRGGQKKNTEAKS